MEIRSDHITAEIDARGAELIRLRHCGRERLWQNETGAWAGHAPVLFPVCGNCGMVVGGKRYPLAKHGFARGSVFTVEELRENAVRLVLFDSEETRKVYPFSFAFAVTYELRGNLLEICYEITNRGKIELPFSCGGHLSYALTEPIGEHFLVFQKEERFRALLHDGDGLLTGEIADMGMGKELYLNETLFRGGNTVIFSGLQSHKVTLFSAHRGALAEADYSGFGNLLLWKPENADMICIEPWLNLPDTVGERLEFEAKRGVVRLAPGASARLVQTVTYF